MGNVGMKAVSENGSVRVVNPCADRYFAAGDTVYWIDGHRQMMHGRICRIMKDCFIIMGIEPDVLSTEVRKDICWAEENCAWEAENLRFNEQVKAYKEHIRDAGSLVGLLLETGYDKFPYRTEARTAAKERAAELGILPQEKMGDMGHQHGSISGNISSFLREAGEGKLEGAPYLERLGVRPEDQAYLGSMMGRIKRFEHVLSHVRNHYLLENYRIALKKNAGFLAVPGFEVHFGFIGKLPAGDKAPWPDFIISVEEAYPAYHVSIGRKDRNTVMETDSDILLLAFLDVYEDYLAEQGLCECR